MIYLCLAHMSEDGVEQKSAMRVGEIDRGVALRMIVKWGVK